MNKEVKIFEENMDKLNHMIEHFTIEDASSYLIDSGLFEDVNELFFLFESISYYTSSSTRDL